MRTTFRLGAAALLVASASLKTDIDYYSALPQDQIALNEYTAAPACEPADAHYLPSFIRAPDGTIIGVGYLEIESDSNC